MKTAETRTWQWFYKPLEHGRESWNRFSLTALRRNQPAKTLTLNFWPSDLGGNQFPFLSYLVCDSPLGQSQRTHKVVQHHASCSNELQKSISCLCLTLKSSVSEYWWYFFSHFTLPLPQTSCVSGRQQQEFGLAVCSLSTDHLLCRRPQSPKSWLLLQAFAIGPCTADPERRGGERTTQSSEWVLPAPPTDARERRHGPAWVL